MLVTTTSRRSYIREGAASVRDVRTVWLASYDPPQVWSPIAATLSDPVRIGERDDYVWAILEAPLTVTDDRGASQRASKVILGSRHQGFDIRRPGQNPMHVYIIRPKGEDADGVEFTPEEVVVHYWGIIYPAEADAVRGAIS
jgi:hypothetical protein